MTRTRTMTALAGLIGGAAVALVGANVNGTQAEQSPQATCIAKTASECAGQMFPVAVPGSAYTSGGGNRMYSIQ